MKYQILTVFILLTCWTIVHSQDLPSSPILTLELGQHRAKLTGVSTDAANRFLVTSCEDKTARVWDLSTGKLLSTLRPPVGDGKDGMLYTAAISPDGAKIAVGGWTGPKWDNSIYVFDRESGRIENRLPGLKEVISNLKFSRNGRYLAAILAGREGLRVYATDTFELIYSDNDYDARSERLDFSWDDRQLVTTSTDGFVRLYTVLERSIALATKAEISDIATPYGVAFSPHGDKIAVGGVDSNRIAIISPIDLSVVSYMVAPSKKADLAKVAWSHDGRALYAGGKYYDASGNQIAYWTGSENVFGTILAGNSMIMDMATLSDGIVFGQHHPMWGVFDSNHKKVHFIDTIIPNYRNSPTGLLVNGKLSAWQFSGSDLQRSPISFSLTDRKLDFGSKFLEKLFPPIVSGKSINVLGCCTGSDSPPQLKGRSLLLDKYETSTSFALLPNEKSFLLGTIWYLRLFDSVGTPVWKVSIPSKAVAVNVSANGQSALVICSDGTVRWYRIADGKEFLAFYAPEDESGRWILWTPSGYYDASPNAEDIIGWTVNNGRDAAADFFPNHLFRSYFFRPDIIDRIIDTLDESVAIELANKKAGRKENDLTIAKILPPVLEVNQTKSRDISVPTVTINYSLRKHTKEPVTGIKVYIDGKQTKSITNFRENSNSITVSVPRRDAELMLAAENRFTTSLPVKIQLNWRGKSEASRVSSIFRRASSQFSLPKIQH